MLPPLQALAGQNIAGRRWWALGWVATLAWAAVCRLCPCWLAWPVGLPAGPASYDGGRTCASLPWWPPCPSHRGRGAPRLQVESAEWSGYRADASRARAERPCTAPQVPPLIDVSWYGGVLRDAQGLVDLQRQPPELRAGERWRMTVRPESAPRVAQPRL